MHAIRMRLRALGLDDRGATAIEYGLIASLIILAMVGGISGLGGGVAGGWDSLAGKVDAAM